MSLPEDRGVVSVSSALPASRPATDRRRRVLAVTCGAHALHDGFTDLIYVLLPVWQAEFALSYAALGVLRMLYVGAMAGLQVPLALLARRLGGPVLLAAEESLQEGYVVLPFLSLGPLAASSQA
jgi:hypothetical protein